MNKQRAQEISKSTEMANVTYEGQQVYIQHVDLERETARIYPLAQRENEQEVPVNALMEH